MRESSTKHNLYFQFFCFYRQLIKIFPFHKIFVEIAGFLMGIIFLFQTSKDNFYKYFHFSHHVLQLGVFRSLLHGPRYCLEKGRNAAWTKFYMESRDQTRKYFTIHKPDDEPNKLRGIFLGAHYGPYMQLPLLKEIAINIRAMVREELGTYLDNRLDHRHNENVKYWSKEKPFFAGKSEILLVKHLIKGNSILLYNDLNYEKGAKTQVTFFGKKKMFNYFPFKISLNYKIPVYFVAYQRAKHSRYELHILKAQPFSTFQEGLEQYILFLEGIIKKNPFMWNYIHTFDEN